ncbi:hypothetical protein H097_08962 [Pseudomonas sp. FH4]|nr:hypothetical protein H097_08962 [Pseudomonas sp. FH4]
MTKGDLRVAFFFPAWNTAVQSTQIKCRRWLASEKLPGAAVILNARVIVDVHRWQASSYRDSLSRASPFPQGGGGFKKHVLASFQPFTKP